MTRWMAQLALELRLLLKYRWPLLLPPAAGLYMAIRLLGGNVYDMADDNLLAFESHAVLMTVTLAVPVLLGVMLIRRDTLHPSYEWSLSLPVSNWTIIGTKWLAGFLYMSLFTLAISAAYAICALKHGMPLSSIAGVLTLTGFMYETYYGISLALGLLLGALMPARFSLPIAFCGWVFGAIFLQLFVAQSLHFYPVRAFFLNHFFIHRYGATKCGASRSQRKNMRGSSRSPSSSDCSCSSGRGRASPGHARCFIRNVPGC
ncbi:hypothetical protein PACILC2_56650 [Paenibacillus cisolokensis]|uniref:ABC transporter permease n=1 Tax=Paenibacillus cisolokensis TaxID=1658519 RepID=A0ABQ4NFS3_9BACL|nr:hypothetical protein PACILC2_56650 [Paenibacillus cisolokensis]